VRCTTLSFEELNENRYGIRLASDERILGSSEFVELALKRAGEAYDRRMRLRFSGIDLSGVIL